MEKYSQKKLTLEQILSPERGYQGHWIGNPGKRLHSLLPESHTGLWGNLSGQWWTHKCTHTCAHCYVSYRWDYNSVTLVTTLLEMPQHPLLGTAGICHSKATCICTAYPIASVCSISAKALQGESWAIRTLPPEMPFLRDGGKQRKAFPF